jgi:YD repeat-containing protein
MLRSLRSLGSVLAGLVSGAFVLASLAAGALWLLPTEVTWAQVPTDCWPTGTRLCTSHQIAPPVYRSFSCTSVLYTDIETLAFQDGFNDAYGSAQCPVVVQGSNWSSGGYYQGPCASGTAPAITYGVETSNAKISSVIEYNPTGLCNNPSTFNLAFLGRERVLNCPAGYISAVGYCWAGSAAMNNGLSAGKNCPTCGNPVSPASGNKYEEEVDYLGGGSFPLRFTRYYNSIMRLANNQNTFVSNSHYSNQLGNGAYVRIATLNPGNWGPAALDAIGANWRHTYQRAIVVMSTNTIVSALAYRHDGKVIPFNLHNGSFVPSTPAINDRLTQLADGTWEYVSAENADEKEIYDSSGKLTQIRARGGETHTLTYDAKGRLATVTDSFGRSLAFQYQLPDTDPNAINRIVGFTDPAGNAYTFAYSATNSLLTGVTRPGDPARQYLYENASFPRALTGIMDEAGIRFATFGYDTAGRANLTKHAGDVGQYTLTYWNSSQLSPGNVTVIDPRGTQRTYMNTGIWGVARHTGITQPAANGVGTKTSSYGHDANGNVNQKIDFNGRLTCYTFNLARNLETSRTEGLAGFGCPGTTIPGVTRTITTQWHATYRLPTLITEPKRTTAFTHDPAGNVLTKTVTDTSVTPNVS